MSKTYKYKEGSKDEHKKARRGHKTKRKEKKQRKERWEEVNE